jgi:hypothetical protein
LGAPLEHVSRRFDILPPQPPPSTACVDIDFAFLGELLEGLDRLELSRISRASAEQRAGRAGRTGPGICLRLWSEAEQRSMSEREESEIRRVDLAGPALQLRCFGESDLSTFPWFEAPSSGSLERATRLLELLGAVGLVYPPTAPIAASCLAALFFAMFPANVRAARHNVTIGRRAATPLPLRTLLQVVFISALVVAGFPDVLAVWWPDPGG